MDSVEIKHYTVLQVRDWLMHNIAAEGLTNEVIRPASAWSIIHNPFVQDDDPIVACIYDNGALAASTCAYPEVLTKPAFRDAKGNQKRIWWFPMLWVKPECRGKGYGLVVIGSLSEIYGEDCSWTAWAVPESIEIFEFIGLRTHYFLRYFYGNKNINTQSFKGQLAKMKQKWQIRWYSRMRLPLPHYNYHLHYLSHIDDASYQFICAHSKGRFFQSSQQMMNWNLQFPRSISAPIISRVPKTGDYFVGVTSLVQNLFVQVWINDELAGVYVLSRDGKALTIDALYYNAVCAETVFASVVEHIQTLKADHVETEDEKLAYFINRYVYFQKFHTESISLSLPPLVKVPERIIR